MPARLSQTSFYIRRKKVVVGVPMDGKVVKSSLSFDRSLSLSEAKHREPRIDQRSTTP